MEGQSMFVLLVIAVLVWIGAKRLYKLIGQAGKKKAPEEPIEERFVVTIESGDADLYEDDKRAVEEAYYQEPGETYAFEDMPVTIHYKDAKGDITNRTIMVKEYDGVYLTGHCMMRNARRSFRVDRIIDAADGTTGEIIEDLSSYMEDKYKNSPSAAMDNAFNEYYDLLRVLLYVVKADERYTAKEKVIVRDLLRSLINHNSVSDKQLDKMMTWIDLPTLHAFKVAVGRLSKAKANAGYDLVQIVEDIINTKKTVHPNEAFALEYIKKRFDR